MGWRYQIPMLTDVGLRVIAPDCLGYGRTVRTRAPIAGSYPVYHQYNNANNADKQDAPKDPHHYSHKSCANDIKKLASQLGISKIIVAGHDWYVSRASIVGLDIEVKVAKS